MIAASKSNKEMIELLIEHGADVNVADEHGKTALIVAAENSNKEMLELLIKHGANINTADESGYKRCKN